MSTPANKLLEKWKEVIDHASYAPIKDMARREVLAQLLENTQNREKTYEERLVEADMASNTSADLGGPLANNTTNISGLDPVLFNLVRRVMPNTIAYDLCGVQAMKGPVGLAFALRARFINSAPDSDLRDNNEAFYNEAPSGFSGVGTASGTNPAVLNDATPGDYTYGTGMQTLDGEKLGTDQGNPWAEMGFTIEKVTVTAKTRALKAEYTTELQQDLQAVHGLSASSILNETLSAELLAEINREVIRTIYVVAKPGAQNTAVPGQFSLDNDTNGRWFLEKFKGLIFQLERESNQIAKETRRGRGNFIVCSSDVGSALATAGLLDTQTRISADLQIDDTGNTFAGVLNGKWKVYIDPYAITPVSGNPNFAMVGYRGSNPMDAGIFYCPYVPLQLAQAVHPTSLQPVMGFKTRYGMVANPFAEGTTQGLGRMLANSNVYFRRFQVRDLDGSNS